MSVSKIAIHEKVLHFLFDKESAITFFDIGACEGLSSVRYKYMFPNATIFAFEPVPNNFKLVKKNQEKFNLENFHPYKLGLSNKKGNATFYISSGKPENKEKPDDNSVDFGNKSSSLFKPGKTKEIHPWLKFKETITIETETLDNFCKNENISSVDFIHMDVQGAELMVLEGAENMLKGIKSIWLEVERIALYKNQALKKDLELFLEENDFICVINKINYVAGDQFWIRKSYFDSLKKNDKEALQKIKRKTFLKSRLSTFFGAIKYNLKYLFK